ncbi:MAG: Zn-dependent hydrolase, partial [Chlorobi bacterium]|nr:Zn-dependent hydrolase [Chlorobiota bacterium]
MNTLRYFSVALILALAFSSCGKQKSASESEASASMNLDIQTLKSRIEAYAPVHISADLSHFTDRQRLLIKKLTEAGHLADEIFWKQSAPDAVAVRDSLSNEYSEEAQLYLKYVLINYGPYDRIYEGRRFVGSGPAEKPAGAAFYPQDMSKEEFETYVQAHPERKAELESQFTVVVRDGDELRGVPFHEAYPEVEEIAQKLEEAAEYTDNPSLKQYLTLRAQALRTDDYYASDMAWMDLKGNDIDVVIGPIEHY